jgi:hypothetical protein
VRESVGRHGEERDKDTERESFSGEGCLTWRLAKKNKKTSVCMYNSTIEDTGAKCEGEERDRERQQKTKTHCECEVFSRGSADVTTENLPIFTTSATNRFENEGINNK